MELWELWATWANLHPMVNLLPNDFYFVSVKSFSYTRTRDSYMHRVICILTFH